MTTPPTLPDVITEAIELAGPLLRQRYGEITFSIKPHRGYFVKVIACRAISPEYSSTIETQRLLGLDDLTTNLDQVEDKIGVVSWRIISAVEFRLMNECFVSLRRIQAMRLKFPLPSLIL